MNDGPSFLTLSDRAIAYQQRRAALSRQNAPGVIFLGGFASNMTGTKASFLDSMAQKDGFALTRFDYRGHGLSSGHFEDGTIGAWFDDSLAVLDQLTHGPQVLVGSSLGGWLGLLLARARPERIAAFIGVAAAPDFTKDLILDVMNDAQKAELKEKGFILDPAVPEEYQAPITARLIEEGSQHLVLTAPLAVKTPVWLLQGQMDPEVPWRHALKIAAQIDSPDVRTILVKDGNHSLSRPQDLDLLMRCVNRYVQRV